MKFRRDLTPEDFWLASRFKHYLLTDGGIAGTLSYQRRQSWALNHKTGAWEPAFLELDPRPALLLPVPVFRRYCRGIARECGATEPQILDALRRLSLLRYDLDRHYKHEHDGVMCLKLEARRMTGAGTIRKRQAAPLEEKRRQAETEAMETCAKLAAETGRPESEFLPMFESILLGPIHAEMKKREADTIRIREEIKQNLADSRLKKKTKG